jgi:hypothetical protein
MIHSINFWVFVSVSICTAIAIIRNLVSKNANPEWRQTAVLFCWLVFFVMLSINSLKEWKHLDFTFVNTPWYGLIILAASLGGAALSLRPVLAIRRMRRQGSKRRYGTPLEDLIIFTFIALVDLILLFIPGF